MIFIKKTNHSTPAEEDVNYLVSVSDLMIAVLFIFILLVVILSIQVKKAKNRQQDPLVSILSVIKKTSEADGVKIEIDQKNGIITLPSDDLFDMGQATLKPQAVKNINKLKAQLSEIIPCYINTERAKQKCPPNLSNSTIETIFIEGHTDKKPLNRGVYNNYHLGLDRARAVYNLLANGTLGNYKNERGQPIFGFSSYGDERLKDPSRDTPNRRVEIRIIMSSFKPAAVMLSSSENE